MKTSIFTTAFNYGASDLTVFLNSARLNGYGGDIVVFGGGLTGDYQSLFQRLDVRFIEIREAPRHFSKARWGLYVPYLRQYDFIIGLDSRDVIIQADLSALSKPGLHVTEEAGPIHIEGYNRQWTIDEYGHAVFDQIKDYPVLCGGTIWGDAESMRKLCVFMNERCESSKVTDQGILNGAVRTGLLTAVVHPNRERVWTLALEGYTGEADPVVPVDHVIENGKLITPDGHTPDMVHQYDRWPSLAKHYQEYYA